MWNIEQSSLSVYRTEFHGHQSINPNEKYLYQSQISCQIHIKAIKADLYKYPHLLAG